MPAGRRPDARYCGERRCDNRRRARAGARSRAQRRDRLRSAASGCVCKWCGPGAPPRPFATATEHEACSRRRQRKPCATCQGPLTRGQCLRCTEKGPETPSPLCSSCGGPRDTSRAPLCYGCRRGAPCPCGARRRREGFLGCAECGPTPHVLSRPYFARCEGCAGETPFRSKGWGRRRCVAGCDAPDRPHRDVCDCGKVVPPGRYLYCGSPCERARQARSQRVRNATRRPRRPTPR